MRRLAEERRIRHEVDLLARMQEGLLPQEMPRLEGYAIAARSVLASEAGGDLYDFLRDDAGRLWIAAGDVAGHGYSCAVAQAMVKAGLLSLVEPAESPAGVLRQLDRVLRGVDTDHSFTSLALIRLDPATGDALLANAGHPYPADRGVRPGDGDRAPRPPPRPRPGAPLRRPRVPAPPGRRARPLLRRPLRGPGPQRQRLRLRARPRGAEGDGAPPGGGDRGRPAQRLPEAPRRRAGAGRCDGGGGEAG